MDRTKPVLASDRLALNTVRKDVFVVPIENPGQTPAYHFRCRHRLGPVPILYVAADVCRSELLVEMEGVLFTKLHQDLPQSP